MTAETVVAIFDNLQSTEAACAELTAAGVPDHAISWTGAPVGATAEGGGVRERGFWSRLFGAEPDHDTGIYDRSVADGASVLTVRASTADMARIAAILERHDPIDLDERAAGYGLTGDGRDHEAEAADGDTIYGRGDAATALSEERLSIERRVVDRGTTRVRRFTVEAADEVVPGSVGRDRVETVRDTPRPEDVGATRDDVPARGGKL